MRMMLVAAMAALIVGCDRPKSMDSTLVEVRVVGIWTAEDCANSHKANGYIPTWFPHTIVEEVATGERCRVMGNAIGATGDVCRVRRCDMRGAGS